MDKITELAVKASTDPNAMSELFDSADVTTIIHWQVTRLTAYARGVVDLDDLYQDARLAVYEAVKQYDPAKGVKFITYMVRIISRRLYDDLQNNQLMYMPANSWQLSIQLKKMLDFGATEEQLQEFKQVNKLTDLTYQGILSYLAHPPGTTLSLDDSVYRDSSDTHESRSSRIVDKRIPDPLEILEKKELTRVIRKYVSDTEYQIMQKECLEEEPLSSSDKRLYQKMVYRLKNNQSFADEVDEWREYPQSAREFKINSDLKALLA